MFVGDTLFMPNAGTARADFPGGDARTLYRSIMRILSFADTMRMFACNDYALSVWKICASATDPERRKLLRLANGSRPHVVYVRADPPIHSGEHEGGRTSHARRSGALFKVPTNGL